MAEEIQAKETQQEPGGLLGLVQEAKEFIDHLMDREEYGETPPSNIPVEMLVDSGLVASSENLARAEEELRRTKPKWFETGKDVVMRGAPVIGIAAIVGAAGVIAAVKTLEHRRKKRDRPKRE